MTLGCHFLPPSLRYLRQEADEPSASVRSSSGRVLRGQRLEVQALLKPTHSFKEVDRLATEEVKFQHVYQRAVIKNITIYIHSSENSLHQMVSTSSNKPINNSPK